jgi:hypothetical protein
VRPSSESLSVRRRETAVRTEVKAVAGRAVSCGHWFESVSPLGGWVAGFSGQLVIQACKLENGVQQLALVQG